MKSVPLCLLSLGGLVCAFKGGAYAEEEAAQLIERLLTARCANADDLPGLHAKLKQEPETYAELVARQLVLPSPQAFDREAVERLEGLVQLVREIGPLEREPACRFFRATNERRQDILRNEGAASAEERATAAIALRRLNGLLFQTIQALTEFHEPCAIDTCISMLDGLNPARGDQGRVALIADYLEQIGPAMPQIKSQLQALVDNQFSPLYKNPDIKRALVSIENGLTNSNANTSSDQEPRNNDNRG